MKAPLRRKPLAERNSSGFSLLEAMLAMFLVFLVLGLTAYLIREYSRVSKHAAARDNTFDGVQFALTELVKEIGSANSILQPASVGASSTTLTLRRLDPTAVRLPDPVLDDYDLWKYEHLDVSTDGTGTEVFIWNPKHPDHQFQVTYSRDAITDQLIRETQRASGVERHIVADMVSGFVVHRLSEDYYEVSLSFQEKQRLRTIVMEARAWISQ